MFPIAVLSFLTAAVVVQSADPYVPTGISPGCATYLINFDTGTSLSGCFAAIKTAVNSSDVTSALNNLCSSSTQNSCPQSAIREELTNFASACQTDMTSAGPVLNLYDTLYNLPGLQNAVCATDDSGNYCVKQISQYATSSSNLQNTISTTQNGVTEPNLSAIGSNNILFLLLNTNSFTNAQCNTCTRKIFNAYTTEQTAVPYAPGSSLSPSLSGQQALYGAITSNCGSNFLNPTVQAAGSLSGGTGSGSTSAALTTIADFKVVAAAIGIVTILASFN